MAYHNLGQHPPVRVCGKTRISVFPPQYDESSYHFLRQFICTAAYGTYHQSELCNECVDKSVYIMILGFQS